VTDLSANAEREGPSPGAIRAFLNIMEKWGVPEDDARALIGSLSDGQYGEMKKKPEHMSDADTLTRISYLVGIFKALNILYSEQLANAWVRLPNTNHIFGGETPLAYMMKGGPAAMQVVRRLLDARIISS
jgi:Protein of unknown function (DUF2384)